jgi:ABC-type lipoprotein export system ATPase subunit
MPVGGARSPSPFPVPVLRARGLRKAYGSGRGARVVLDGVDLDLARGELVAVVGRSGTGKSTLLHLLGGLDRADAGSVEVVGRPVTGTSERELSALRRDAIGFVFQFFHLVPELDGEANVLLPTRLPGASREAARRGRALIERLELGEVARLAPHQLSGGEQQRFALARALVADPALVLADEPIGNLDAASGAVVLDLLRAIADDGRGVLMVTHQAEATARADRVLHLTEGRLVPSDESGAGEVDHAEGAASPPRPRRAAR